MSSQLGKVGCEGRNVYNMNKFGIEGLARGMAVELAEYNIRVNTVCPTFVETPMVKKFFKNISFFNPGSIDFKIEIVKIVLNFFEPFFGQVFPELIATGWHEIFSSS